MNKPTTILSLSQALAAGYTWAVEDGEDHGFKITNLSPEEVADYRTRQPETLIWLCDIEEKSLIISPEEINEQMGDLIANQDSFNDEDGELLEIADKVFEENRSFYEQLAAALNEALKEKGFICPSNTAIDFTL